MILASQSPRRRELLAFISPDFRVIPAVGEESISEGMAPEQAVKLLALQKAREIFAEQMGEIIIAADTVVSIDGAILGKPNNKTHAANMLRMLSGNFHNVYTGVCVIFGNGEMELFCEETRVEFYPLSDKDINDYIATGEPMDKAGAYGIQGKGALLVKRIEGDFYNVMGLPVGRLARVLRGRI